MDSIKPLLPIEECSECQHHTMGKIDDTCRRCLDACDHGQGRLINFTPIEENTVADAEKSCTNCRYERYETHQEPCNSCINHDEWEPQVIDVIATAQSEYGQALARSIDKEMCEATFDAVNSPSHYMLFPDGTEVIDVIRAALTPEEFIGYCKGNTLKYRLRAGKKDDLQQDINKAETYVGMMEE